MTIDIIIMINPRKHASFVLVDAVKTACTAVIHSNSPIDTFYMAKIYNDGSRMALSSNGDLLEHAFIKSDFYTKNYIPQHFGKEKFSIVETEYINLPSNVQSSYLDIFQREKEALKFACYLNIYEHHPDGMAIFSFIVKNDQQRCINYFLNHLTELENFTKQFQQNVAPLIKIASLDKITQAWMPDKTIQTMTPALEKEKNFLNLTQRHKQLAFYVMRGMTAKQIASSLDISKRTVDQHITDMKKRLAVHTKQGLIQWLWQNSQTLS